jgi:hypothetical protein
MNDINNINIINISIYKIFVLINHQIINQTYLLNNVETKIKPLFMNSNILEFGVSNNKLELFIVENIKETQLYYIEKFKIIFSFIDNDTNKTFSYILILGITWYNGNNMNILKKNITETTTDLGFINYSILESDITLSPIIFNLNKNLKIYEESINFNLNDIKKYNYLLDYEYLSLYKGCKNNISFNNFYYIIPNIITKLKTNNRNYYNNFMNILMLKINNYIKNIININDNFLNFKYNNTFIKNNINLITLYDENII